jgi:hypothetical protein
MWENGEAIRTRYARPIPVVILSEAEGYAAAILKPQTTNQNLSSRPKRSAAEGPAFPLAGAPTPGAPHLALEMWENGEAIGSANLPLVEIRAKRAF